MLIVAVHHLLPWGNYGQTVLLLTWQYKGSASEAWRAMRLMKKREREREQMEQLKQKIAKAIRKRRRGKNPGLARSSLTDREREDNILTSKNKDFYINHKNKFCARPYAVEQELMPSTGVQFSHTDHWMFNMAPHGRELYEDLRVRIVALHKDGSGYKKISNTLKLHYKRCITGAEAGFKNRCMSAASSQCSDHMPHTATSQFSYPPSQKTLLKLAQKKACKQEQELSKSTPPR
ncbi:protein FAM50A [Silurus meridionalis]|nr:protein FAM50A [Silurus meridionalis]